jgi:DNA-binding response OmpR family regulator
MSFETRSQKVMIAENDRAVAEMLQIRLDVAGYHTMACRNGVQTMEILSAMRPDVLILDLGLPDMDGWAILQALNNRFGKPPFPVLVMGRRLGVEDVRRAVTMGARDCLAKPFSGAEIVDRVERLLRRPAPVATAVAAARQLAAVESRF